MTDDECGPNTRGTIAMGVQEAVLELAVPFYDMGGIFTDTEILAKIYRQYDNNSTRPSKMATEARYHFGKVQKVEQRLKHRLGLDANTSKRSVGVAKSILVAGKLIFKALGMVKAIMPITEVLAPLALSIFAFSNEASKIDKKIYKHITESNFNMTGIYKALSFTSFQDTCHKVARQHEDLMVSISLAENNIFYPTLFNEEVINQAHQSLSQTISQSSMKLVAPLDLYTESVQILTNHTHLIYHFSIPIMPESFPLMCLHRYLFKPFVLQQENAVVELKPKKDYLAVDESGDFHKELMKADLEECWMREKIRYCSSTVINSGSHGCLGAITYGNINEAIKTCDLLIHRETPYVYAHNSTEYYAFTHNPTEYNIKCSGRIVERGTTALKLQGFSLNPGCSLSIDTVYVSHSENIYQYIGTNVTERVLNDALNATDKSLSDLITELRDFNFQTINLQQTLLKKEFLSKANMSQYFS